MTEQRAEKIKQERRRRNTDALGGRRRRMAIDESQLDKENFVYRFANDDDRGRIHQLTVQDDWEVVPDRDAKIAANPQGDGSKVSFHAGTMERGASMQTVLLRKPKRYADEDYAARQRRIDEVETGLRQGNAPGATDDGQIYVPKEGITLNRG